ncbi:MAG: DUF488 domain-containing protein [Nitrososphaeraceae archaeon]
MRNDDKTFKCLRYSYHYCSNYNCCYSYLSFGTTHHSEKLGGRRNKLDTKEDRHTDNNNTERKNNSFRAYADYMATTSFREGISGLLSLMQKYPNLAIMCAEAVTWRCHRRMIADYLVMVEVEGISVFDILDGVRQPASHELTSFAHLTDDKIITYPEKDIMDCF